MKIKVVFSFNAVKVARQMALGAKGEDVRWAYLGKDFSVRRLMARKLGAHFRPLDLTRPFHQVAAEVKQDYVAWQDRLNEMVGEDSEWWFGAVSSRHVGQSRLFRSICLLETVKRAVDFKADGDLLLIVDSPGMAETIQRWVASKGAAADIYSGDFIFHRIAKDVYTFLRWAKFWAAQLLRSLAALISRRPMSLKDFGDKDTFVLTTLHDYSLTAEGRFSDRYFPGLYEVLAREARRVLVFPFFYGFCFNYLSIFQRLRKSEMSFVIREDLLTWRDYWAALTCPFRVWQRKIHAENCLEFDLNPLIEEEVREEDVVLGADPVLNERAMRRLSAVAPALEDAILWYENRIIDRAIVMGLRYAYPRVRIKGVEMFLYPDFLLSLIPCASEVKVGIVPDVILTTSEYEARLARQFYPSLFVEPAAALRYKDVFGKAERSASVISSGKKSVLVLLPYDISEAVDMLGMISQFLQEMPSSAAFLIRTHPDYTLEEVKRLFNAAWPEEFLLANGSLTELLTEAMVVISGMSSSMVEAAIRGIPVICVSAPASFEKSYLSEFNLGLSAECYTLAEFLEAMKKFLALSEGERLACQREGERLRQIFFLPVTDETLRPYLRKGVV